VNARVASAAEAASIGAVRAPEPATLEPLDTDIAIETPEHIVFRHRLAGPARRAFAYLFDITLCYGTLIFIAFVIIAFAAGFSGLSAATDEVSGALAAGIGVILFLTFCVEWVYFVVCEGRWGTTPGKRLFGLAVVTTEGRPIGFSEAALRNVLRAADLLPIGYLVGVTTMACTQRFQRLGDLLAGTMVVITQRADARAIPIALYPPATDQELAGFPAVVRLDADERAAIELFLRRRVALGAAREHELAEMLVEPLSSRYDFSGKDPARVLAILYDLAMNAGRGDAPPSSRHSTPPPNPNPNANWGTGRSWP
jgi:uncharacterized RDD family membrane protein YckC